jgi:hypothetical protein
MREVASLSRGTSIPPQGKLWSKAAGEPESVAGLSNVLVVLLVEG